ncbi:MAG: VOC family protein [Verrucomicrobia bacterium]|nr:VOC family protein [Verrucomicrobiota bacterium]
MLNGWISLRVKDPKQVAAWYTDHKMLELVGAREDIGTRALGSRENGLALILISGDQLDRPDLLQLHLHVKDVDAEYERLKAEGVKFEEPPKNMPWGWRHAYTKDPAGHTVEVCSPLPEAGFKQ